MNESEELSQKEKRERTIVRKEIERKLLRKREKKEEKWEKENAKRMREIKRKRDLEKVGEKDRE